LLPTTSPRVAPTSFFRSFRQHAGDDEPLDLLRALVDLRNLRVTHKSLDRIILRIAVSAVYLDCLHRDLHRGIARHQLCHCGFLAVRKAVRLEPGRLISKETGSLDRSCHVSK